MKVAVPAESLPGERRVALVPDAIAPLVRAGLQIAVQTGAGRHALATDEDYAAAGAEVVTSIDAGEVDVLLHVRPLHPKVATKLRPGSITIGLASPATEQATVVALAEAGITSFAMELVPRISRAQSMDALTSQALVAGYRCVLEAAMRLPRFFPLFMTAAGTVPPAKVLVLGAGVAGLQAIATAKRLGAVVSAYDVRAASADEVRSMGATFVDLGLDALEGAGGYAREMGADRAARQQAALAPSVAAADVVVTTASVPGRRAPLLVTDEMLAGMKPGSVIVDLAAESGGNVAGSLPGQDVEVALPGGGTVMLVGMKDAASTLPVDASRLYAKNVANLLMLMTKDGVVAPDFDDEVVAGACLTHGGQVVHGPTAQALAEAGLLSGVAVPVTEPAEPTTTVVDPAAGVPASEAPTDVIEATAEPVVIADAAPASEALTQVMAPAEDDDGPAFDVGRDERLDAPEEGQAR
ncbi:MAG: NAD(P) transhydrogenase subunit alpha [Kineosporiaceae bacterium]